MTYTIVREDGVLLVTMIGAARLEDLMLLRAKVRLAWLEQPTRAALYDYRLATFEVSQPAWDWLYSAAARWKLTECSYNAIVAAPPDLNAFLTRGSRYAALGVCYAVFTDFARALHWALENPLPAKPRRTARR